MAIIIQTQETLIPITLGKLQFTFDASDKAIEQFEKNAHVILKEIETVSQGNATNDDAKAILARGYDMVLGEGAFEKVYEQTPSLVRATNQFMQLMQAIADEISNLSLVSTQQQKAEQYLRKVNQPTGKKKKKQKR